MKRKTLKDIKVKKGINNSTIRKDIKEEAIKWVKDDLLILDELKFDTKERIIANLLIRRNMERFNITEEDLEEAGK